VSATSSTVHLGHLLAGALDRHRDDPVLEIGGHVITGGEMSGQIAMYVAALAELGVDTGSAVGMLAANRPEVLLVIGAGQARGYRRTALHPLGSLEDHAYVLADAGVSTLIVDTVPAFLERAAALLERVESLTQVLTLGPADFGTDLVAAAAAQPEQALRVADLAPDAVVSVTYTGGTTGRPKGVIGTALSMAAMTQVQLAEWEWPDAPKFLMATPLSHAGAAFFVPTLMKGGSMYVVPKFDPADVLRVIEDQRITATMLVPSMIYALLDHPDSQTRDLTSLETVYYGASSINPTRLAEAIDRFGPIFAQYYGQSECPMVISYLAKADHLALVEEGAQQVSVVEEGAQQVSVVEEGAQQVSVVEEGAQQVSVVEEGALAPVSRPHPRLASCGRPSAWLRSELRGDDGSKVSPGEPGEIWVSGPVLAGGYWELPEQTAETFVDGWLRTGDVARADEDGFWYIVDRTKDMIVTGGFNVFPREVEDVIATHPAVAQVAVIGTPDEKWGEAVTALVVPRPGSTLDDPAVAGIQALVKEKKGSVQVPKRVIAVDSIPMTALGKPDKKSLRAAYAG
jgi:fatty-acyl-CoA synthase